MDLPALHIARLDLLRSLRQKEVLLWTFLMPLLFFWFLGTVTGGGSGATASRPTLALWLEPEAGFLGELLAERLEARGFALARPATREEFSAHSRRVLVPRGFTAGVLAGVPQTVQFQRRRADLRGEHDRIRVARAVYSLLADTLIAPQPLTLASVRALEQVERPLQLRVSQAGPAPASIPQGFEQTVPGTTVMFTLLVLLTSGATQLVVERRQGALARLACAPVSPGSLVAGKWLGQLSLGLVQIGFGVLAGAWLFDLDWGPSPAGLALLLGAWAALCASLALALGNLARSEGQAVGLGLVATLSLAALGGCWWPIEVVPAGLQQLARWLPSGWAMDGMHRLVSFGQSARSILPHVAAMLALAALLGYAVARRFRTR